MDEREEPEQYSDDQNVGCYPKYPGHLFSPLCFERLQSARGDFCPEGSYRRFSNTKNAMDLICRIGEFSQKRAIKSVHGMHLWLHFANCIHSDTHAAN